MKSSLVYYDSLPFDNNRPRPFNDFPELQELIYVEFPRINRISSGPRGISCMVVLRYWQLFYNEQHTHLGKEARDQVRQQQRGERH